MWPSKYHLTAAVIVAISAASIQAATITSGTHHEADNIISEADKEFNDQLVIEGRGTSKLRKAILPLMLGIILKVGSIVPMKLMIMAFFALTSLLVSKFALLLAAAVGLFHHKAASSHNQRFTSAAIGEPYHLPISDHAAFASGETHFSPFPSGEGDSGFGVPSSSSASLGADSAVFSANDLKLGHKRRRVIMN